MRVLLTGAGGQLAVDLVEAFADTVLTAVPRTELDVTDEAAVSTVVRAVVPDVVLNTAGLTDVDACEHDPEAAHAVHALGPWWLATACRDVGARLVTFSTDHVFGGATPAGAADTGYGEADAPAPVNRYGRSKAAGEALVRETLAAHHLVRTSWFMGVHGSGFATAILAQAAAGTPLDVVDDQVGSPTSTRDLAQAVRRLVAARRFGTIHLANSGSCSRFALAEALLEDGGHDTPVRAVPTSAAPGGARRPAFSPLDTTHAASLGLGLPPWREAVARFVDDLVDTGRHTRGRA